MGADDQRTVARQDLVCAQDVRGRADLPTSEAFFRDTKEHEQVLHLSDGRALGEDGQDVEAELSGEFEARKNENRAEEAPKLGEAIRFFGLQPVEVLEKLKILDLSPEIGVTTNRVVIGQSDGVETTLFGAVKDIHHANAGVLVVGRSRRMNVKVDAFPGESVGSRRRNGSRAKTLR